MTSLPTDGLHREILPNGVTLLVQRRRTAPAASLVTHLRAGFLDEPDDVLGISHVLEHMLFKGTRTLGPGQLAQQTRALGGTLNAYTAYDRTVYYASAPARHIASLIALQSDQVQHASIDAGELHRELRVISQEARRKLDNPGSVAGETLHQLLFSTHRLRRWRIGYEADIEQFTREQVAGYYHTRYVPARAIVALVGDVDEAVALDALRDAWVGWNRLATDIPPGPGETSVPVVAARRLAGDVTRTDLVLGWRAPGVLDADIPALEVLAAVLASGRASRFGRQLRDAGLVNNVGAGVYGVVDAGVFSIGAELDPANVARMLAVVGDTLRDLATHTVASAEFDRAQSLLRASMARRLERYESRATALAEAEALGDVTRVDRELAELAAVTPAVLRTVAARWLAAAGAAAVAYFPRGNDTIFDGDTLRAGLASGAPGIASASVAPSDVAPVAMPPATKVTATVTRLSRATVHHLALAGVDILAARFGDTGQVSLQVHRLQEQPETASTAGLSSLTARMMTRGTRTLDAAALAFAFESMGGALHSSVGADTFGLGTMVLAEHVSSATDLLLDVLYHPRFDPDVFSTERTLLLDDARAVTDDMVRFPIQLALGQAFGDTGYGSPVLGTPDSVSRLSQGDVVARHASLLAGGGTLIVAVGDADPAALVDQLAAAMQRSGAAVDRGTTIPRADSQVVRAGVRIDYRDRQQSALAMLFPGPARRDRDRFTAEVWSAVASGLGGRLFESLRSARSLAYSVIANSWQRRCAGGLLTYIACDPGRLDEARDAMLAELDRFRHEPPDAVEMSRAIASLAGEVEMSPQTAGALAGEIADAWLVGEGLVELDDPAARYRAVTGEAVRQLMQQALDPDRRAEGVVAARAG